MDIEEGSHDTLICTKKFISIDPEVHPNEVTEKIVSNFQTVIERKQHCVLTTVKEDYVELPPKKAAQRRSITTRDTQNHERFYSRGSSVPFSERIDRKRSNTIKKNKTQLFETEDRKEVKFVNLKDFLKKVIDSNIQLFVMAFLTAFALFASDIKSISIDPQHDDAFNILFYIVLASFILELLITWYTKSGYFNSFFFWLDILSILSMIFEIEWVLLPLIDSLIL
jgi:hypothetical protein